LFAPYSALGIYALFKNSGYFTNILFRRVSSITLLALILITNLALVSNIPGKTHRTAINVGYNLKNLMETESTDASNTAMIERSYWDFLIIKLTASKFDRIRLDREIGSERQRPRKNDNRNPSIFLTLEDEEILQYLRKENTKFVVVKDENIKNKLNNLDFIHKFKQLDNWDFYRIDLERSND
jgi:hypothetical protein